MRRRSCVLTMVPRSKRDQNIGGWRSFGVILIGELFFQNLQCLKINGDVYMTRRRSVTICDIYAPETQQKKTEKLNLT